MNEKIIVITGASKGLGRALAELFKNEGHEVFTCGRSRRLDFDPIYNYSPVDVSDYSQVKIWTINILKQVGAPDLLIHNAALINELTCLEKIPAKDFKALIDVNVTGVLNVTSCLIAPMKTRKKGGVVGISSYWGREGAKSVVPYVASKFAVEGICQSLALELDAPMFSVPLNPGIIDTDMLYTCFGEHSHEYPNATQWAEKAGPFILSLSRRHNGESMTVPGF